MLPSIDHLNNRWIYGPTGTGKSRGVRESVPAADLFNKAINKWWDGYNGQPVVLLDDFGKEHAVLGHYLKQWADHYAFQAETKGGSIRIRPRELIVTSNYHPKELWDDPQILEPILRRFDLIHHVKLG